MKTLNAPSDPRAHRMEHNIAAVAARLIREWNGPGQAPPAGTFVQTCTDSFNLIWTTAQQTADATTLIRAVSQFGELYITASKGPHALSLNVRHVLTALTGALRPGDLPTSHTSGELPAGWAETLQHNARCLVLTVDRMHTSGLNQDDAYQDVLEEQTRTQRYPRLNVLEHDGTFSQRLPATGLQN